MQEMDENKKKIIILASVIGAIILIVVLGIFVIMPAMLNHSAKKGLNVINETESKSEIDGDEPTMTLEEQAKQTFNMIFTAYETEDGQTLTNTSISMLFTTLAKHNTEDQERKVDVNGTIVTSDNIDELKQILTNDLRYTVKCILDEEGYVKTIELRYTSSEESQNGEDSEENNQNDNEQSNDQDNEQNDEQEPEQRNDENQEGNEEE